MLSIPLSTMNLVKDSLNMKKAELTFVQVCFFAVRKA
jgi:hypothetical protein